jgi:hypothetical protein
MRVRDKKTRAKQRTIKTKARHRKAHLIFVLSPEKKKKVITLFKSLSSGSPVRPVGILGAISTSIRSKTVQKKKGPAVTSKKGEGKKIAFKN